MKKLFYSIFALAACLASAETYYLDVKNVVSKYGKDLYLSNSVSYQNASNETVYFWYTLDSTKTIPTPVTTQINFNSPTDDFYLSNYKGNSGNLKPIYIDTDIVCNSLYLGSLWGVVAATSPDIKINVNSVRSNGYACGITGKNTNLVTKDVLNGDWQDPIFFGSAVMNIGAMGSLNVSGTWTVYGHSGGYWSNMYVTGVANHSVDKADAVINILSGMASTSSAHLGMIGYGIGASNNTALINEDSFVWVNQMKNTVGFQAGGSNSSTGVMTLVMTNNVDASTSGSFWEGTVTKEGVYTARTQGAKIKLVMRSSTANGDGTYNYLNNTQSITGDHINFSGGVEMLSGTLLINYAAIGADATHGNLKLSKALGATSTTLGNSNATLGGSFMFTNLVVSDGGGSIRVRMEANDTMDDIVCDTLSFTGNASGAGVVVIDLKNYNGNRPDDMLDFMIDHNLTIKVISWSAFADSSIEFTTTDDYKTYNFNGQDYVFNAVNAADGLYINYILSVPEPAAIAALFGALALAFASLRSAGRRK